MYQFCSIVLPVCNQADHMGAIVDEYLEGLAGLSIPSELILVVNGSDDDSLATCKALAHRQGSVRCVHSQKGGWGLAVKLGLRSARGDLLCYTNSARTSPNDLVLLVKYALENQNVVVKASRKIRESVFRRFGSLLYNLECRFLFDLSVWDINGTPKLFPRHFQPLMELSQNGDLIDVEFLVRCRRNDYPILDVPIFSFKRHGGKSSTNIYSAFRMYTGVWRLRRTLDGKCS